MTNIKFIDFERVLETREKNISIFEVLEGKINKLKTLYNELLNNHKSKDYVFGIDSLHFQNSLIEIEYNGLKNIMTKIDNRVYCEYYNLYNIINEYITTNFNGIHELTKLCVKNQFPVYKHLEKDKIYGINLTKAIQKVIMNLLHKLSEILLNKEEELENDRKKSKLGLNIDNLINAESFNNIMLKGKVEMYKLYLETFNSHHNKYYTRLLLKCKLHMGIVSQDIILNNSEQANSTLNNDMDSDIKNVFIETKENVLINSEDENTIKTLVDFNKENSNTKDVLNSIISTVSDRSNSVNSNEDVE